MTGFQKNLDCEGFKAIVTVHKQVIARKSHGGPPEGNTSKPAKKSHFGDPQKNSTKETIIKTDFNHQRIIL